MSGEQEQESIEAEEAAVPGSSAAQYTVSSVHQVLSLEREAGRRRAELVRRRAAVSRGAGGFLASVAGRQMLTTPALLELLKWNTPTVRTLYENCKILQSIFRCAATLYFNQFFSDWFCL